MSMPITCPQCRAALKLPDALPADRIVACPNCQLKFVPPPPATAMPAPAQGSGGTAVVLALMALVLGTGVGILVWNSYANRDQNPPAKGQASGGTPPANLEIAKGGSTVKPVQPVETGAAAAPPSQATPPTPMPAAGKDDELPDQPKPVIKKPPQKSYAETKRPQLDEPPAPAVDIKPAPPPAVVADHPRQKQINEAIDKGVAHLKSTQLDNGSWPKRAGNNIVQFTYDVGYASLAGLTLLECQVPADDRVVQKAAAFVRSTRIEDSHRTYELACAILFLDRLGDPKDKARIQSYALQLVAGQNIRGGWGYACPDMTGVELQQLLTFLEATRPPAPEVRLPADKKDGAVPDDPVKKPAEKGGKAEAKKPAAKPKVPPFQSLSRNVGMIPIVHTYYFQKPQNVQQPPLVQPGGGVNLWAMSDDNSNSQFAMLGLWTARRHGIPTERSLIGAANRYRTTQHKLDGGWAYPGPGGMMGPIDIPDPVGESTPTMTCVGLLGLAMGHGVAAKPSAKLAEDPAIARGLSKLGHHINGSEMNNFYLLWSVERVAVLYQLKTIGNNDWYDVGVGMLLPLQQADGSWSSQSYQGSTTTLDTCFALLFLKRSNLVQDLTERLPFLMAITEPGTRPNR